MLNKIWDLFEDGNLFTPFKNGQINDEQHLAEMVALLGPPPKVVLQRSEKYSQHWDSEGEILTKTFRTHII